ncbi:MAG: hypothetical protein DI582_06605 [Azospirillum brasilense]|nr:MAG: hypothetical protein DI582_06605 [Azospirillum brasilense]
MASTKKKPTAKRVVKAAVKTQTRAAHAAASVAKSAASKQGEWARQSADWAQQGANEWAKQSAKMYQLPFAAGDVNEATRQAAEQVKSATESFVRAGNDMMSQMFGGAADPMAQWKGLFNQAAQRMPSMAGLPGANEAAAKMQNLARESADQMARTTGTANRAMGEAMELARENAEAMVECSNIAISVSKEIGAELITYANKTFSQNVELGKQLLSCRTLNDMFDLSSKFMKTNLDSFFSESVKLSEKMFQCATDVSEPLNERLSDTSDRMSKVIAA